MVGFPLLCYYVSLPDGNWVVIGKFNWDSSWFVTHQDSFFFPHAPSKWVYSFSSANSREGTIPTR